ncbi:hypothetical protein Tco_0537067 [Tanacetum coccineum]
MSIEEMMREQLMVDDEIKDISNYLSYKRFQGEKIDDEYERDCEIKIEHLLQDYNGLGIEIRKKERILMEEKSLAVSRLENLVPIPSEFEGISDDTCDVPVRDDSSTFDALNNHSEILSDSNDDGTSSDDDDFEDIEYVILEEVNDVDQEEKEFDLEDIFQIQDVILQEKLLNINRLITNIESLKDNPTPDRVLESPSPFLLDIRKRLGHPVYFTVQYSS